LYLENGHTVIQCNIRDITERKKAEKSVEESEERLRLATEGAGVGIWEVTTATGEIIYSQKCYEIFDLPENDTVPITVERILAKIHPDDVEHVRGALERSLRDKCEYHAEYRVPVVGRRMRWVYSTGKPHLDESGQMEKLQGVITDITDRKHVEAILAASAVKNERIAETLQRSMLQSSPRGKFQGVSVETLYEASLAEAEVGGDFFDALALDAEHVALIVGDVSGKGLDAAGRTAEVKYALRAFLHENHEPSVALTHLNRFICESHRFDKDGWETFIVLAIVVLNTITGEAIFSSAGSEPTLVLRKNGEVEQVEIVGTPLGIQSDSEYPTDSRMLEQGDTIIMATDGITEARQGTDFLGIEGMALLAEEAGSTKTLLELCQSVYAGAVEFSGGRLRDDVCLLLARRQ
jgi:PAS domain S-box-containing protein